ncbi:FtsW/RodA/SpoVE family cell cycle protein [Porphyromonadaceae bacterium W3.11]|nr:FtsW/RodA/SpoVE family cell cycle protein [Porphyromonadaceae bacterium W3.11]
MGDHNTDNDTVLSNYKIPFMNKTLSDLFIGSRSIWGVMIVLMLVSTWVIFSASSTKAFESLNQGSSFFLFFGKHLFFMLIALCFCVGVSHIGTKYFKRYSTVILIASVFLLILVFFVGNDINDAKRSLSIGPISFQPSELARLALINYVAALLHLPKGEHASIKTFKKIAYATVLVCGIIFIDNISTAVILASVIYFMALIGRANKKMMFRTTLVAVAGFIFVAGVIIMMPDPKDIESGAAERTFVGKALSKVGRSSTGVMRIKRFVTQVNAPINETTYSDSSNKDLQVVSSQKAIANGGLMGVGFGKSELRNFLPEAYSDFAFSIILEERGLLGAIIVIGAYLALFFFVGGIARESRGTYRSLLTMGIGLIITLQAIIHILICVNLFPITGQNLPFVSKGGSSYVITAIYFGILLSASNEGKIIRQREVADASGIEGMPVVEANKVPDLTDDFQSGYEEMKDEYEGD